MIFLSIIVILFTHREEVDVTTCDKINEIFVTKMWHNASFTKHQISRILFVFVNKSCFFAFVRSGDPNSIQRNWQTSERREPTAFVCLCLPRGERLEKINKEKEKKRCLCCCYCCYFCNCCAATVLLHATASYCWQLRLLLLLLLLVPMPSMP